MMGSTLTGMGSTPWGQTTWSMVQVALGGDTGCTDHRLDCHGELSLQAARAELNSHSQDSHMPPAVGRAGRIGWFLPQAQSPASSNTLEHRAWRTSSLLTWAWHPVRPGSAKVPDREVLAATRWVQEAAREPLLQAGTWGAG